MIKVLPSKIYNKIAAGEVVERPVSVVKELVENSIDAECSRIKITLNNAGMGLIEVVDNGNGIPEKDIDLAFLNHATSKISTVENLDAIKTLGFRGEALSSIAAVSKVKLTSKTACDEVATEIEVEDGEIVSKKQCAGNVGTKIEVFDLFYNTPARLKFLKTSRAEVADIKQYVNKLILTMPFLEVTLIIDGETVIDYKGNTLEEAIFTIYGKECLAKCLPISSTYNNITVKGYVGSPEYLKSNSTYQTVSINGRFVRNDTIHMAVKRMFSKYLTYRAYPFFVLALTIPFDEVDVNVHPNKLDVRFSDSRTVFAAVSYPIRDALNLFERNRVDNFVAATTLPADILNSRTTVPAHDSFIHVDDYATEQDKSKYAVDSYAPVQARNEQDMRHQHDNEIAAAYKASLATNSADTAASLAQKDVKITPQKPKKDTILEDYASQFVYPNLEKTAPKQVDTILQESFIDKSPFSFENVKVLGVAFLTYLILQIGEDIIFVDQHAAHERILYDKFMLVHNASHMQPLLSPFVFLADDAEAAFIEENLAEINEGGIEVQPFGDNTFRITAVSTVFSNVAVDTLVRSILRSINEIKFDSKQLISDAVAKRACKAATKAGRHLNDDEIEYIIRAMAQNKALCCPHGRPLTVTISKSEFEKMFKRTV